MHYADGAHEETLLNERLTFKLLLWLPQFFIFSSRYANKGTGDLYLFLDIIEKLRYISVAKHTTQCLAFDIMSSK